jgi:large subunit ribosomal protein L25
MSEERLTITAEPRTVTGKQVKQLRRAGVIPAVIYGQKEPVNIQLERGALRRVLKQTSTSHLLDIQVDGQTRIVLARDIQQHATRGDLVHVDFYEVNMQATLEAEAELVLAGETDSTIAGLGTVVLLLHAVDIECLPGDLVAEIEVDVTTIKTPDDVIHVSDLAIPNGVTILTDPETVVAHFEYTQTAEAEAAEAGVSVEDVQVIEKGKAEEE